MQIDDRIYGKLTIKEKVIADLINSKPLQRLKHINQAGSVYFIQPVRNVTRFEHSIGTWYLSQKFNRPIEEQIASLLHDVPHTAFSHVIDFVVNDPDQEYHDQFTKEIIMNSEIPGILESHTIDIKKVLHKENFYLLDNKLPDISVDRWDYFMRDGFSFGILPKSLIQLFLNEMREEKERFYFEDIHTASLFAVLFMNCSRLIWLDPTSHGAFFLMAEALKKGLKKRVLSREDFFKTDQDVFEKLQKAKDSEINMFLERLQKNKDFIYAPEEEADFYGVNKPRYVDPLVKVKEKLEPVSKHVLGLKEYFEEFHNRYRYIGVKQKT